jgi:hypothetical protein
MKAFLQNLSGTIQNVWDSTVPLNFRDSVSGESGSEGWKKKVIRQTEAYGVPNPDDYIARHTALRDVLETQQKM